jgi:putative IMPACT (imprinted ancient) family translation regulator
VSSQPFLYLIRSHLTSIYEVTQQIETIIDEEVEAQVQAQLAYHIPPTLQQTVANNQQQLHDVQYSLHNA